MSGNPTPGPWRIHDRTRFDQGVLITSEDGTVAVARTIQNQAAFGSDTPDQLRRNAQLARDNAALISASPCLLAACEKALADYESDIRIAMDPTPCEEPEGNPLRCSTIDLLRAAIAKAKGESS